MSPSSGSLFQFSSLSIDLASLRALSHHLPSPRRSAPACGVVVGIAVRLGRATCHNVSIIVPIAFPRAWFLTQPITPHCFVPTTHYTRHNPATELTTASVYSQSQILLRPEEPSLSARIALGKLRGGIRGRRSSSVLLVLRSRVRGTSAGSAGVGVPVPTERTTHALSGLAPRRPCPSLLLLMLLLLHLMRPPS